MPPGWRSALAVAMVGAGAACASGGRSAGSAPAPAARDDLPASPLAPGDAILVNFSRTSEQNGTYQVEPGGDVALPYLGRRNVTAVPPDSLRRELIAAYEERLRNQAIQVRPLRRVRVLGSVREPGLYHVDATMTLADLVAQAGGATDDGALDDIRVMRGQDVVLTDVEAGAGAFEYLSSGDQVFVSRRSWFSRNSAVLISASLSAVGFIVGLAAF